MSGDASNVTKIGKEKSDVTLAYEDMAQKVILCTSSYVLKIICSLQLLCHLSHQHFLSLPTQNTENVLQAERRCNYPLPVKISFKVQNFHFQLSLFVDSIFYILVAKMVRYSQDIIIELQSGLEA